MADPVKRETLPLDALARDREGGKRTAIQMAHAAKQRIKAMRMGVIAGVIDDVALVRGDLMEYEWVIEGWPVERLVKMCRDIGPVRCDEVLMAMRLSPRKKVGHLDWERRAVLARLIAEAREW